MLDGMTNIKASEVLKEIKYYTEDLPPYSPDEVAEALEMAIKALEPKPMEKFDDVKTHIQRLAGDYKCWDNRLTWEEALELNRMLEAQPSEDCIRREEMLKYQQYLHGKMSNEENHKLWNFIKGLPSVTPQRPKGKWIDFNWNDGDICRWGIKCSECHTEYKHGGEMWHNPKFCPNCGSYNGGAE